MDWAKLGAGEKPLWSYDCKASPPSGWRASLAVAVCSNAVVIAEASKIVALNVEDGGVLWSHPLPAAPVEWGLAVDKDGRAVVTLENGKVLCYGRT